VFAEFLRQDSGCRSYGVELEGERWFVKHAVEPRAVSSLRRAIALHERVQHPTIIGLQAWFPTTLGPALVYPWRNGHSLYPADEGPEAAYSRFGRLPLADVMRAIDDLVDAHVVICAAGFVAVDLYDGCFVYDFDARRLQLCDLDEYRPGPFVVEGDRLPGSHRFMAPEELTRGAVIDERTTVFNLGRAIGVLLGSGRAWRGSPAQRALMEQATHAEPGRRQPTVAELAAQWSAAGA
jgi:serine/threonine-protein kinase